MAEDKIVKTAPVSAGGSFFKRELNGATFLTLEHIGYMLLVLVVTLLIATGSLSLISLWSGGSSMASPLAMGAASPIMGSNIPWLEATMAVGMVAALVVLVPLMALLGRRTRAEIAKRPEYTSRIAYKAPIYTTLGVLVAIKVGLVVQLLTIVLTSLALIGVENVNVGQVYINEFLPLVGVTIIVSCSAFYLFKLAKGKDMGKMYDLGVAVLGLLLAVALFVGSVITFHKKPETIENPGGYPGSTVPTMPGAGGGGDDFLQNMPQQGAPSAEELKDILNNY
ncbi:MAG TPA: hypothetical protein VFO38_03340 [Candidatus Saccharimonadales bacterium]|nr:hypothetical protein [Candidatus Saccharimonadales bacterium]